jgi:hypothetical protein
MQVPSGGTDVLDVLRQDGSQELAKRGPAPCGTLSGPRWTPRRPPPVNHGIGSWSFCGRLPLRCLRRYPTQRTPTLTRRLVETSTAAGPIHAFVGCGDRLRHAHWCEALSPERAVSSQRSSPGPGSDPRQT